MPGVEEFSRRRQWLSLARRSAGSIRSSRCRETARIDKAGPAGINQLAVPAKCKAVGKWLMVLSLCAALGLHWAALQSVAWVGMLVSYSRSGSVASAIANT